MLIGTGLQGWISLPVVFLLLTVAGLSVAYQERLEEGFLWRSTLNELGQTDTLWQAFEKALVVTPEYKLARPSECLGFCPFNPSQNTNLLRWHYNGAEFHYAWHYHHDSQGRIFYRLCARHQQRDYCWWWQQNTLTSRGYVMSLF